MNRKCVLIALMFSGLFNGLHAQPASDSLNYPRLNRPCPDFVLKNIKYFSKKEAKLSDFRGKWLLLSFWNKLCGACIASFPRENNWHLKYADKMQFMSVAIQDKEGEIEPMFARYRERENLSFPVAFDSTLANRWGLYAGPYFILIDPDGVVRDRAYLTGDLLAAFMEGKNPKVPPSAEYQFEKDPRVKMDSKRPFLVNGNGGTDSIFAYRSLISEFDCMTQSTSRFHAFIYETRKLEGYTNESLNELQNGRFQVVGIPLRNLYSYAWLGAWNPEWANKLSPGTWVDKVLLDVKDSSLFFGNLDCYNRFCYSLTLPESKATKQKVMHIMQQDLENYFGFTGVIEERKVTTWKLIATNREKLKTKGGKSWVDITSKTEDYKATNIPWSSCYSTIFNGPLSDLEVVDSTGITGNIDIDMHCSFMQLESVRKALKENGLELVPVESTKKVLVIRDMSATYPLQSK